MTTIKLLENLANEVLGISKLNYDKRLPFIDARALINYSVSKCKQQLDDEYESLIEVTKNYV